MQAVDQQTLRNVATPPRDAYRLPRGRVEAVMLFASAEGAGRQKWRVSFDLNRFSIGPDGRPLSEKKWVPRVRHVIRTMGAILQEFTSRRWIPVFIGKGDGDHMRVYVWKNTKSRAVTVVDVAGWRVEVLELDRGKQCPMGFDPKLAPIEDLRWFMSGEPN